MTSDFLRVDYDHGVTAIDSGLLGPGMAACYLLDAGDSLVVIETGINRSTGRILQCIADMGRAPEHVSHVIVTHVHLDHAGGAGSLMQQLPHAKLLAHPHAARHLIDPARLEASTRQVYGNAFFDATYGTLVPIEASRVRIMEDNDRLLIGERSFRFIDTPGHARHHFVVWDELSRGWFSGDTFGISYRATDTEKGPMIFPTTTPIQFDPPALIHSIDRMMEAKPQWVYLTHFGRVGDTERLAEDLKSGVRFLQSLAERRATASHRTKIIQQEMMQWLMEKARAHGCVQTDDELSEVFKNDVLLNTQGLEFMLDHPR